MFNPSDFQSVQISVIFHNLTSHADPVAPEHIVLEEIQEDALVLGVPKTSCNLKHNVMLEIVRQDPGQPGVLKLQATAKVTEVEKTEEADRIRVKVSLVQYDEETWKKFLTAGEDRQEAIMRFLNEARG